MHTCNHTGVGTTKDAGAGLYPRSLHSRHGCPLYRCLRLPAAQSHVHTGTGVKALAAAQNQHLAQADDVIYFVTSIRSCYFTQRTFLLRIEEFLSAVSVVRRLVRILSSFVPVCLLSLSLSLYCH